MNQQQNNLQSNLQSKVYSMLGLAMKAGKAVSGEFATEKSVKDGSARLVLVSEDASDNTKKLFSNKCAHYEVPGYVFGTKEGLGHTLGKSERSSLAITDENFAKSVIKHLEQSANPDMRKGHGYKNGKNENI